MEFAFVLFIGAISTNHGINHFFLSHHQMNIELMKENERKKWQKSQQLRFLFKENRVAIIIEEQIIAYE